MPPRKLSLDAVVTAAVTLADAGGIATLTMRQLARELGVEAMSLYHHVPNKDALLDAMVDVVYAEIALPTTGKPWRFELRRRSHSVREVLRRHPWALPLMESRRAPGSANLAYHEANIACLRQAGFTPGQVATAYAVLDAFVYGFALQESTLPFDTGEGAVTMVRDEPMGALIAEHPHMAWFVEQVVMAPGYDFGREFDTGLNLVLDGIARWAQDARSTSAPASERSVK